jgi:hypothetical protein
LREKSKINIIFQLEEAIALPNTFRKPFMPNSPYESTALTNTIILNSVATDSIPVMTQIEPLAPIPLARIVYCGRNPDGRHRLKCNDQKFLVTGAIYALSKGTDHKGNVLYLKLLLDMTPGYRIEPRDEQTFDAVCAATGARMFIQGRASACTTKSKA